jgi:GT2 family glycosyltransferase
MNPVVSVIYVNYNTSALLLQSISSLIVQCREIPFEILVIDNASKNDDKLNLQAGISELKHDHIHVQYSADNLGFSKANNFGAKQAKGKYLFFLNPDTLIVNDVIKIFCEFLDSANQNTVACGGNLLKEDGSPNYSYGNFPGLLYEICSIGFGLRYLFNDYYQKHVFIGRTVEGTEILKAPYITGADIFIRTDTFHLLTGFDENFFMYYEETDLFKRLEKEGYQSYIIPGAKIIHFEGGSVGKSSAGAFNYGKFEMTLRSKLYYFQKWFPQRNTRILKVVVLLQILVQYLKGNKGGNFNKLIRIYRENTNISKTPAASRLDEMSRGN